MRLLRYALVLLGWLCLLAVCCLYEDGEKKVHSRIDEWWLRVRDTKPPDLAESTAFFQATAILTERGFDWVFGKEVISPRMVGVSECFSFASLFMCAFFFHQPMGARNLSTPLLCLPHLVNLLLSAYFVALALMPAIAESSSAWFIERGCLAPNKWIPFSWSVLLCISLMSVVWLASLTLYHTHGVVAFYIMTVVLGAGLYVGLLSQVVGIALTRWFLQCSSRVGHPLKLALILHFQLPLTLTLALAPALIGYKLWKYSPALCGAVLLGTVFNGILLPMSCSEQLVFLLLRLHRLLWPVLRRPMCFLQQYGVIRNKTLLWFIGIMLVTLPTEIGLAFWRSLFAGFG